MGFRDVNGGIRGVCYGCEMRYPACHDTCETYINAKNEYEERKRKIDIERDKFKQYDLYKLEMVRKTRAKGRNQTKFMESNAHKR